MNKEYEIVKATVEGYDKFIICLSSESLSSYITKIEKTLMEDTVDGNLLIDQLLITGNVSNRFISLSFSNGMFDVATAQIVNPADYYRETTIEWLHNHYHYVEHSILTTEQRQNIKDNIAF